MAARRGLIGAVAATLAGITAGSGQLLGAPPPKEITLAPIGVYRTGYLDQGGSEIAAYDPATKRLFTVNLKDQRVDVIDIADPTKPYLTLTLPITTWGSQANSVAVHDGVIAVAVEASPKTSAGTVVFFNAYGAFLSAVTVGALPDMLTFTPNGEMVLVANEGEPNSYGLAGSVDPEGSVSIIDLTNGADHLTAADVTTARFTAFNNATLDSSIRIFGPGASVAQDLEPEYIAVSHDSKTAWVTLQENNAIGILDLRSKQFTRLVGLGFKNHNLPGNGLDPSDRDGHTNAIQNYPIFGMYQPDGVAALFHKGRTYLITANEGDVREWPGLPTGAESRRVGSLGLDPIRFPNAAALKLNGALGRLNVTFYNGNTDADADFEALYAFGARSFSVWDEDATQIFDSGDAIERITAARYPPVPGDPSQPGYFNSNHSNNLNTGATANDWTHDSRSDDKGPEPENVTIAKVFGRDYAFIVLERIGGVMVYELTDPAAPRFVDYINVRKFGVAAALAEAEDLGPEGIIVIGEDESPTGKPLVVIANEVSGTTRIFEIRQEK